MFVHVSYMYYPLYCVRFSRNILWLKLSTTNNDPAVVLKHYLDTVVKLQGRFSFLRVTLD